MFAAAAIARERVFVAAIMPGGAYVAAAVARFVSMEVVERLFSAPGEWAMIAVMWVVAVIDVAIEAARAVKPGTGSDKQAPCEPVRAVVAVGRAIIRSVVEVAIGANGRPTNSDANGNLGMGRGRKSEKRNCESCESKEFCLDHGFLLISS